MKEEWPSGEVQKLSYKWSQENSTLTSFPLLSSQGTPIRQIHRPTEGPEHVAVGPRAGCETGECVQQVTHTPNSQLPLDFKTHTFPTSLDLTIQSISYSNNPI